MATCKKCGMPKADKCYSCAGMRDYERDQRKMNAATRRRNGQFTSPRNDGTTLYGPRETEGRPGHKHGHRGDNFDRSPHSTIGSAALGDAHTTNEHKVKRTKRW